MKKLSFKIPRVEKLLTPAFLSVPAKGPWLTCIIVRYIIYQQLIIARSHCHQGQYLP
jgi:hypothetical protein